MISWDESLGPVFDERKMPGGAEPPTEFIARLRQLVGSSSFKSQQHKAAGGSLVIDWNHLTAKFRREDVRGKRRRALPQEEGAPA